MQLKHFYSDTPLAYLSTPNQLSIKSTTKSKKQKNVNERKNESDLCREILVLLYESCTGHATKLDRLLEQIARAFRSETVQANVSEKPQKSSEEAFLVFELFFHSNYCTFYTPMNKTLSHSHSHTFANYTMYTHSFSPSIFLYLCLSLFLSLFLFLSISLYVFLFSPSIYLFLLL